VIAETKRRLPRYRYRPTRPHLFLVTQGCWMDGSGDEPVNSTVSHPFRAMRGGARTFGCIVLALLCVFAPATVTADQKAPDDDVLLKAMVDELNRSMAELVLADLPRPYFIQYRASDRLSHTIDATNGTLLGSNKAHTRTFASRVRVGSYELDNTNVGGSGGARATLPLDDDYIAIRHAIWQATDQDYKNAVETLTRKQAYLREKNIEDRPEDFTPAEPLLVFEPPAKIAFDPKQWEDNANLLSARFIRFPDIQRSNLSLFAGTVNEYIVNSEGSRLRMADTGLHIEINAEIQAQEGMLLSDNLTYIAERMSQLPPVERMLADIDEMCARLMELSKAPTLEHYTGPVLFDPIPAGKVFEALLAEQVCAAPTPLGAGGSWGEDNLEKKLGRRILPRSFQLYDDPIPDLYEGTLLAGHYAYDDEAVRAVRVSIVDDGILENLVAARAPTRKVKQSTGHGRSAGLADARARIGCLYISDTDGLPAGELRQLLIQTAREEGLDFGLRVESMWPGGFAALGRPVYAYKVYVDDGREELVRGLEFLPVRTTILKRILAAGRERQVYNSLSGGTSSIVSPAILLEELDLAKFEEEFDKLPILKSPALRPSERAVHDN